MNASEKSSDQDPIAEEGRCLLAQDAALRADLDDFGARLSRGEVSEHEVLPHGEVVRRLGLLQNSSETPVE